MKRLRNPTRISKFIPQIKYQLYRKPLYHLLTMLCAIVGGVVTVAGVLDKILFNTHELVRQKMAIGKLSWVFNSG